MLISSSSSSIILKMGAASAISWSESTNGSFCRMLSLKIWSCFSSIAFLDSHVFLFLKQQISLSSEPSMADARPHEFIELSIVLLLIALHDVRTHSTTNLLGTSFMLPAAVYPCFPFASHSSYSSCILPLMSLFHKFGALMYLVEPLGTKTVFVLESFKDFF